jgi:hypothetical protein
MSTAHSYASCKPCIRCDAEGPQVWIATTNGLCLECRLRPPPEDSLLTALRRYATVEG